MGPLLIIIGIIACPDIGPSKEALGDVSRIRHALAETVYVVEDDGLERYGRLLQADSTKLTLAAGARAITIETDRVARVDRPRDRTIDGVVKGAAVGFILGVLGHQGLNGSARGFISGQMVAFAGLGYVLDVAHAKRTPVYQAGDAIPAGH